MRLVWGWGMGWGGRRAIMSPFFGSDNVTGYLMLPMLLILVYRNLYGNPEKYCK